jgi:hypothetical protein
LEISRTIYSLAVMLQIDIFKYYFCHSKLIIMKSFFLAFIIIVTGCTLANAQTNNSKFRPEGKWKFEAPSAPEGYTFGTMDVAFMEKKYSVAMGLPGGGDDKLPAEQIQFENGELTFKLYIQGEEISIFLKPEGNDKMTGKAIYSGGEIPLTCDRQKDK